MLVLTKLTHVKKSLPSSVVTDCFEVIVMLPIFRVSSRYARCTGIGYRLAKVLMWL